MKVQNQTSRRFLFFAVFTILPCLASCTRAPANVDIADSQLRVVATTTLVGDIVREVAGDLINLTILMPVGVDPHSFEPVPQDVAAVAAADLIFLNGLGVEIFLDEMIVNAGGDAQVISVSEGITPLYLGDPAKPREFDPHVWFNPLNVVIWARNIAAALSEADLANASVYQANADTYGRELVALDQWAQDQLAQIPQAERLLVTDHDAFGYFSEHYGYQLVGAVVPGFSTLAEPSAQEVAALETTIKDLGAKAIFVGNTVNPGLGERIAQDTGIQLVFVYTGSLSEPGGPAADYLAYFRYNVNAIVGALMAGAAE